MTSANTEKNYPLKSIKLGNIVISIWKSKQSDVDEPAYITIDRTGEKKGIWFKSRYFRPEDLKTIKYAIIEAIEYVEKFEIKDCWNNSDTVIAKKPPLKEIVDVDDDEDEKDCIFSKKTKKDE